MSVALYLYLVVRIREQGEAPLRLALAGGLLGLAILQRSSNAVFFVVAVAVLLRTRPAAALRRFARSCAIVGVCAALSGIVPLLAANKIIFGRAHPPTPTGRTSSGRGTRTPWLLLFDERGGLFDAAPVSVGSPCAGLNCCCYAGRTRAGLALPPPAALLRRVRGSTSRRRRWTGGARGDC